MRPAWKIPREMKGSTRAAQILQRDFTLRLVVAFVFMVLLFAGLIGNFVYLQVIRHDDYVVKAASNRITLIPTPPIRGEVVDKNGVVLAHNYPAYSLELIPSELESDVDDTIAALRHYVELSDADLARFKNFVPNTVLMKKFH